MFDELAAACRRTSRGTPIRLADESIVAGNTLDNAQGRVFAIRLKNAVEEFNNNAGLAGKLTVHAVKGVAAFSDLILKQAGTYSLAVTGTNVGSVVTGQISVNAAVASKLAITMQPPSKATVGVGFGLTVTVEDAFGNPVTTFNSTVTLALAHNPVGGTLGGTSKRHGGRRCGDFQRGDLRQEGQWLYPERHGYRPEERNFLGHRRHRGASCDPAETKKEKKLRKRAQVLPGGAFAW